VPQPTRPAKTLTIWPDINMRIIAGYPHQWSLLLRWAWQQQ
jgi:hypothetical protein